MLSAVLIDVGGTLWPDRLPGRSADDPCLPQLTALLPQLEPAQCLLALRQALAADDQPLVQNTHAALASALYSLGAECEPEQVVAIRRAICAPAVPSIALFTGARELLETIRELGLRCVVLSNVQVRGADEYWRDFADLGIAHLLDAVVTSLEVGFRKPHHAMFQAGLSAARCSPSECVMVGDSELKDIEPARQLGMRAIRVSVEEPPSAPTCAHRTATSLHQVNSILREWAQAR